MKKYDIVFIFRTLTVVFWVIIVGQFLAINLFGVLSKNTSFIITSSAGVFALVFSMYYMLVAKNSEFYIKQNYPTTKKKLFWEICGMLAGNLFVAIGLGMNKFNVEDSMTTFIIVAVILAIISLYSYVFAKKIFNRIKDN
jgi:hypothetical protein